MEGRKEPFWLTAWGTVYHGRKVKATGGWDSWLPCVPFPQLRTPVHEMRLPIFWVHLPKKHLHPYTQSCLSKSSQLDNDNWLLHIQENLTGKKVKQQIYFSKKQRIPSPLHGLLSHHFPCFDLKETWLFRGVCSPQPWGRRRTLMSNPGGPVAFSRDWLQVIANKMWGEATQRLLGKFP